MRIRIHPPQQLLPISTRTLYLFLLLAPIAPGYCAAQPVPHLPDANLSLQRCSDPQLLKSDPFAAACYWRSFLIDEKGAIPPDAKLKAYEHVQKMRALNKAGGIGGPSSWTPLGPGNVGGRIRSIVRHPTDSGTIWIGSVSGGVFKTTDGGTTWSATNDFMASLAISTLVLDPSDGTSSTLYAGTGESFSVPDAARGAGIFRTTDGGITWTQLVGTGTSDFWYVNRLALSSEGNALLAATSTGLWLNPDVKNASTWTRVIATSNPYTHGFDILDVAFNPSDNTKAIASTYGLAWYVSSGSDARLTTATWTPATFSPALSSSSPLRVELAYAPSNASISYASAEENGGDLFQSTDGGASYTRVNTGTNYFINDESEQGNYDNALWVDPTNSETLVVGGIRLWLSTNGGKSLTQISEDDGHGTPPSPHADQHVIISDPGYNGSSNKIVFIGNDGGIYRTSDITSAGNNPPDYTNGWTTLDNNLPITQFYNAAAHAATGRISGGTQDNGTLGYTNSSSVWAKWIWGDGGYTVADPTDLTGNIWYGEFASLQMLRTTTGFNFDSLNFIYAGDNAGCSGIADAGNLSTALFISPFVLDPNDANTILAGGTSLWRSSNIKADTPCWMPIKGIVSFGSVIPRISAIAVAKENSDLIWVGYENGAISSTTNGTTSSPTWSSVHNNLPLPSRKITSIAIDPNNANNVYVAFGGYSSGNIWRTTDGGTTWADISRGLPSIPILSIAIKPDNSNWLYIGTDLGIFDTENALDTSPVWSVNDGPANVAVTDLFWLSTGPSTHTLLAATYGRGVWKTTNPLPAGSVTVTLSADSTTGPAPFTTDLTARVSGSAGNVNYTFWWNCPASISTVQEGISQCGDPTNPSIGAKFDTLSTTTFSVTSSPYASPGIYKALVVAERGSGAAVASVDLVVDPAGISLSLIPKPASGAAPLDVFLTATVAGGAGTLDYSIWWNCNVAGTNLALLSAQCGALPTPSPGQCQSSAIGYMCKGLAASQIITPFYTYVTPGSYTPKAVVVSGTSSIARQSTVTVTGATGTIPTPLTPGYSSEPGEQIDSLIPILTWTGVTGADAYGVYVSKYPYGESNLVFQDETVPGSATTVQLPPDALVANERYRWNIRALTGSQWSGFSQRLYFATAPCAYSISPTQETAGPATTTLSPAVSVSTNTGCSWFWESHASWISAGFGFCSSTGSASSGNSLSVCVAANTGASRTGTITIAGQTFTVAQGAAGCSYSIEPDKRTFLPGGEIGTISITAGAGCSWNSASKAGWITITNGSSGSGSGNVTYTVAANTSTASRSADIVIAGTTLTVYQGGVGCAYSISPAQETAGPATTTLSPAVSVSTNTGCSWSWESHASWISAGFGFCSSMGSASSGNSLSVCAAANTGASRTGTITIAGQTFTVAQGAAGCSYSIEPDKRTFLPGSEIGTISITAGAGCSWNSASKAGWITITNGSSGSGSGNVTYMVAANTSTTSRSADIVIAGTTLTVYQGGVGCAYSISPAQETAGPATTTLSPAVSVSTNTGCYWSWESHASWISAGFGFCSSTGSASSGNSLSVCAAANTGASRTGTITIAGQTFTVAQGAAGCSYSIEPDKRTFLPGGEIGTISITAGAGCSWNSASKAGWITITNGSSGSGSGNVTYTVAANTSTTSRSADIVIAGTTLTVYQGGVGCAYSISPAQETAGPATTTLSPAVSVSTNTGCYWSWESHASWISAGFGSCSSTGSASSGNSLSVCAAANTGASRTGTITIAGQTFTVVQNGSSCNPIATPTATNNGPLCAGNDLHLSAATIAGAVYKWSGPNGFTSTVQNPTISSASTASGGLYSVTASIGECTSAVATTTVVVNQTPSLPAITAPLSVVSGVGGLSASVAPHTGSTYNWSITNGTITAGNGTNQVTFKAGSTGTLALSVIEKNSSNCPSPLASASVTVLPLVIFSNGLENGSTSSWSGSVPP